MVHRTVAGLLVLCGCGSAGLDASLRVKDLEPFELAGLCLDIATEPRTVDCGEGLEVTIGEDAFDCQEFWQAVPAACDATVGDATACAAARSMQTDAEACDFLDPPAACAPLADEDCQPSKA